VPISVNGTGICDGSAIGIGLVLLVAGILFNDVNFNDLTLPLWKKKNSESPNEISIAEPVNKEPKDCTLK
jgi:hypothetical protein